MNDTDLKSRLREWALVHGNTRLGQRCDDPGTLAVSQGNSVGADEIEHIAQRMEQSGRWRESRVLRAEYFLAKLSETERLQRLSRIGLVMSRAAYYVYLASGRAFVAGALMGGSQSILCNSMMARGNEKESDGSGAEK